MLKVFINNCFNRDSFSIFNENLNLVSNYLFQDITQSDLGENQVRVRDQ